MRYEEELIEEVREKNDIVDVISSYVSLKKKGSSWFGLCPFHNEKSPSFSVSRDKQMYYCFGCGQGGNVYTFLMEYNRMSFVEALQQLAQRAGVELPAAEQTARRKTEADARTVLKEMNKQAAVYFHYLLHSRRGEKAMQYLKNRGISEEMIKRSSGVCRFVPGRSVSVSERKRVHRLSDERVFPGDHRRGKGQLR